MEDQTKPQSGPQPKPAKYTTKPDHYSITIPRPSWDKVGRFRDKNPRRWRGGLVAIIVIICFLVGLLGGLVGSSIYDGGHNSPTSIAAQKQYISNQSQLIASIAKNVGQSVVSIDVNSQTLSQDFFGFSQPVSQQSAGTGFIVSSDGIIITNRHVVPDGTDSVTVTLSDGTKYTNVQVIGRTSDSSALDVAFLKIGDLKGKKLTPVTLGDSSKMQVGDEVVAIGNALGQFQNTVTSGIISGHGRDVQAGDQSGDSTENLTDLFQTDAAINEGNSGGPLVNINGQVIGLNTAVASGAQNIGFAIPINDVKGLINSVLASGKLQQTYLGVRYVSLTPDLAYQYNLNVDQGAYIVPSPDGTPSVIPGSPADKAGLQEKDIITKVNNISINSQNSLTSVLTQFKVGQAVNLTVVRGSKTISLNAVLAAAPNS
ncbi:MAG TPA: trypsin-like peptidase domain-containing protein [Candidatus Saccharimonadales bacterium]|nr:trypsin-like peptidase domain-containing protein [Candidatus Saccharimonadales bacterium]